jgi:anti-sigma B factor antagonist
MDVSRRQKNDIIILDVEGEFTLFSMTYLRDYISKLIEQNIIKIVLNCAKISRVDSAGLGILIGLHSSLNKKSGGLRFYNTIDLVNEVFRLTKTDKMFQIFNTEEEAVNSF